MAGFTLLYVYSLQSALAEDETGFSRRERSKGEGMRKGARRRRTGGRGGGGEKGGKERVSQRGSWKCAEEEGGGRSTVRFYEIKGHIVTGITSIRKRRIQATGRTWN